MSRVKARNQLLAIASPTFRLREKEDSAIAQTLSNYQQPSHEETMAELEKWKAFARTCKIISGSQVIPFSPWGFQESLFYVFWRFRMVIVGKPRQHGLTETITNILLYCAKDNPAYSAAAFSKGGSDTSKLSERATLMAVTAGLALRKANTEEIGIEGGGTLLFRNSSPDNARSLASLDALLFDELAFVKDAKKIWAAALPAQSMLGPRARTIVISTPPPPAADPKKITFYMQLLTTGNGDRSIAETANKMRRGDIDPVQWWITDDGVCKFLVHWRAHPIYSDRANHLELVQKEQQITKAVCAREHDLGFNVQQDEGIVNTEWFGRYTPLQVPAKPFFILQSWDTAQTDSPTSSDWAGITLFIDGDRILVIDVVCDKFLVPDGEQKIIDTANTYRPHTILIEGKSSGHSIIQRLKRSSTFRYPIKKIEPPKMPGGFGDAKILRFEQELPAIREGMLHLPDKTYAPAWLDQFESAIAAVGTPEGKTVQDIPDALSQALHYIRTQLLSDRDSPNRDGRLLGGSMR